MEHAAPAPVTQSQDSEPKKRKGALTNEDVLMAHVAPNLNYMDLFSLVKTTKQMRSLLRHEHALTAVLLNADDKFGKNAKATIRNVLSLYGEGKIHKPSPMRLLRLANVPQLAYTSTSPLLSDKEKYPTFSRVVPPDTFQGPALAALCFSQNWTSVGMISTTDEYSTEVRSLPSPFPPRSDLPAVIFNHGRGYDFHGPSRARACH